MEPCVSHVALIDVGCQIIEVTSRVRKPPPPPEPEPMPAPVAVQEAMRPARQQHVSGIPVRRRPCFVPEIDVSEPAFQTEDHQLLTSSSPSSKPHDVIGVLPDQTGAALAVPTTLSAGDGARLHDVDLIPLNRIKDVYIEATTLEREVRLTKKQMDPNSRAELRRIIEHCRARLDNATNTNNSTAANTHAEGPAATTVLQGVGKPPAATSSPRPSRLRQPLVRRSLTSL